MPLLVPAIVLITAALVAYTVGVWAEHRNGELRPWHVVAFGLGLLFDVSGTLLMGVLARSGETFATGEVGAFLTQLMAVTGAVALVLMAVHFAWALHVLTRGTATARRTFHRFSTAVWTVWLVPYFTGMAAAMMRS